MRQGRCQESSSFGQGPLYEEQGRFLRGGKAGVVGEEEEETGSLVSIQC